MRVAFLGLGRMGVATAAHVAAAGHDLTVWNRTPGKAGELADRERDTIAEAVDGAEVVVLFPSAWRRPRSSRRPVQQQVCAVSMPPWRVR